MTTIPALLYGTAWKKHQTTALVEQAVRAGFRGIDTACQPKHYDEQAVGQALQNLYSMNVVQRADMFIQTKFTSVNGQDPRTIPYNPQSSLTDQVQTSFRVSQRHLGDYIDSYVLHSPMRREQDTREVWRAMEALVDNGYVGILGISNCYDIELLQRLYEWSRVKPSIVQNRFYADTGYDSEIRRFCINHSIQYQSFWTLSANPHLLAHPSLMRLRPQHTPAQVLFRYLIQRHVCVLTGTTSAQHMHDDLNVLTDQALVLQEQELAIIDKLLLLVH